MVLLYKEGDLQLLSSWRLFSLINTDAKLFTKMLANRFNIVLPSLINPYQTGFIPNWLISNNGQLNQVLMVNLKHASPQSPYVAIFLDHKKAYDCVRPGHLSHILFQFGFPSSLVSCLSPLLFNMRILISTNGRLGKPIPQFWGLRQGNSLSPLLLNLAFKPLLWLILSRRPLTGVLLHPISLQFMQKPSPLPGIQMATASNPTNFVSQTYKQPLHPVKLLSYADNLKVFLSHPGEWLILLHILDTYGKASNARVSLQKTALLSLSFSETSHPQWVNIVSTQGVQWHGSTSISYVRYLGYLLHSANYQLQAFLRELKVKIQQYSFLLKARDLSVRRIGIVANPLLLSKLWHALRVVLAPKQWLQEICMIVRTFVVPSKPAPSWPTLCRKKKHCGISLVDVEDQNMALYMVCLKHLLSGGKAKSDFLTP